jgi:hypothetical protein
LTLEWNIYSLLSDKHTCTDLKFVSPCIRTPKRILQWNPIGTRTRGRPRKRWIAGIEEDLQIIGVRWWRKQCEERAEWKKITEKAKTHSGL